MLQTTHTFNALTNDNIMRRAPSVFATNAALSVSDQYKFIPTIEVIDSLRSEGWHVVKATEQRVRSLDRQGFQKHMLRLRREATSTMQVGDSLPELVLTNGHDGKTAYTLHAGLFRLVCSNGLVVSDATFEKVSVIHKGFEPSQVINASYRVLENLPKVQALVESMREVKLIEGEKQAFAEAALTLKYDTKEDSPIDAERLLQVRRNADLEPTLWNTFNTIQENLIQGGQRGRTKTNNRTTTREVRGIDNNIKLNKSLWLLAERMKELKGAAL